MGSTSRSLGSKPSPTCPLIKRNRFIVLEGTAKRVNRELEARAGTAGIKDYVANLATCFDGTPVTVEFVFGSYHRLFEIQKPFRTSKSSLQGRPVNHLTIVFDVLAVSRWDRGTVRLVD